MAKVQPVCDATKLASDIQFLETKKAEIITRIQDPSIKGLTCSSLWREQYAIQVQLEPLLILQKVKEANQEINRIEGELEVVICASPLDPAQNERLLSELDKAVLEEQKLQDNLESLLNKACLLCDQMKSCC
jgi:hypothetical protein